MAKKYFPSKEEFAKLAKQANIIPVYREIVADYDTPVSAFRKIARSDYSFLLESVEGPEKVARYSFIGTDAELVFKSKGRDIYIKENGRESRFRTKADPLDEIKKIMFKYKPAGLGSLPRFCGGLVGYMGYDLVRFFEKLPDKNADDLKLPDCIFVMCNLLLAFDHLNHSMKVISFSRARHGAYDEAIKKIDSAIAQLKRPLLQMKKAKKSSSLPARVQSNFTKKGFEQAVRDAKKYVQKGDIIQTVLSQRFEIKFDGAPFDIYRSLRSINPSPYMYYLDFKEAKVAGSSPELFVRVEDDKAEMRPIAGTRRRGKDDREDDVLAKELLADPKERAEHIMLVDLGRNDLGRVSKYGTVKVVDDMVIERYSHVMHIVSSCVGKLEKGKDLYDVIRATFPAGTVSGAPKVRAMEIIDELENVRRGPYAGFVGYFSFSGNLDTCITIRTIVVAGNRCYIQSGAGIVADSKPSREYEETLNKAKAMIKALENAYDFNDR